LTEIASNAVKFAGFLNDCSISSQIHRFSKIQRRVYTKFAMKVCPTGQKICLYPGRPQNPMLITISKCIKDYRQKIGTSK